MTAADTSTETEESKKVKAEVERLLANIEEAKANGREHILTFSEKRLAEIRPKVASPTLDTAKDAKTVMSDRVRLLHEHQGKCNALEAKCTKATDAIKKHEEALEREIKAEKERHEKAMRQIRDDVARMIKNENEIIKEATESLKRQKLDFEEADESYNGFIAKHLPSEAAITPKDVTTDLIAQHLLKDEKLAGIIDLQATGVAQSLCALLNAIVEGKTKSKEEEEENMDLDERENAAADDRQRAVDQMEGGTGKTLRRRGGKPGADSMDQSGATAGKREADAVETEPPPAPKCLTLPPKLPEQFNLADADEETKARETKVPEE